jgi:excisionase family DNA binding protein
MVRYPKHKETKLQQLMTENEIADMLRLSTRSIRKARQSGSLPHVRLGRLVRYRVEDVREFVANAVVANDHQPTSNMTTRRGNAERVIGFIERQERR